MKNRLLLLLVFVLTACSLFERDLPVSKYSYNEQRRYVANEEELAGLKNYLRIDKFHHYIVEYVNAHGKKIDETSLNILKGITPEFVKANYINDSRIDDAMLYDEIIIDIIKAQNAGNLPMSEESYSWGYNFFKRKVNEAFLYSDHRIKVEDKSNLTSIVPTNVSELSPISYDLEDLTLDADHYISNRTTRAVMWEANETGRGVDFHFENPREFLKNISESGGEVIAEIQPLAKNYNKIYVVKYPSDSTFRYAFTNIGGNDRLKHLILQFNLSKLSSEVNPPQLRFFGSVEKMHEEMTDELTGLMRHMPDAKRTIIGQKGAIERTMMVLWKLRALNDYYNSNSTNKNKLLSEVEQKHKAKFKALMGDGNVEEFDLFKNKKVIETAFDSLKDDIESAGLLPESFKRYDYDNFVISMADFEFQNSADQTVIWRVIANSWGDEISPLAQALTNIGQKNITYIGTAGAFPNSGAGVGSLVIPSHTRYNGVTKPLTGTPLSVDGAITSGTVDYVYSPFIETVDWLDEADANAQYVEVETGHLNDIFPEDVNYRAYLLISDVLGSEGETLATASSAKRRNALNKLLYALMKRDKVGIPNVSKRELNKVEKLRLIVERLYGNKANTFQHFIIASLLNEDNPTEQSVKAFAESTASFSDNYFGKRITAASEMTSFISRKLEEENISPKVFVNRDFVDGIWHPKSDKISVWFHAENEADKETIDGIIQVYNDQLQQIKGWTKIASTTGPPNEDMISIPRWVSTNADYLVDLYSQSSFRLSGLDAQVTYNGNIKFNFVATNKNTPVCEAGKFCHLSFFAPDQTTKDLLSEIDTDEKLNAKLINNFNSSDYLEIAVAEVNAAIKDVGDYEGFASEVKVIDNYDFEDGRLAEIVPTFDEEKGLVIELRFAPGAKSNPIVVLEETTHLRQIANGGFFKSPIFWAEVSKNAELGSMRSKHYMLRAEIDALEKIETYISSLGTDESITSYLAARKAHLAKINKAMKKKLRAENKARKAAGNTWKELQNNLQNANMKLDDYIAANDRQGAAKLISAFMPWEQMEPTEVNMWLKWLEVMKNPSQDESELMVTFRGLGDDLVKESNDGGHFLMAKLLTKNQGNYTRRLRSFKSFFKKRLSKQVHSSMPIDLQLLANIFKGHSNNPNGSPFLSTSVFDVASGFAWSQSNQRIVAIKMDKRRNLLNLVSSYDSEVEQMVPLIIFPDEIIHLEDGQNTSMDSFLTKTEEKLGRSLEVFEKSSENYNSHEILVNNVREWWNGIQGQTQFATEHCQEALNIFNLNN